MSVSNSDSGSLVAMLSMFVFISVSSSASCMVVVVGGGFFGESIPFPIGVEASSPLYRLAIGV